MRSKCCCERKELAEHETLIVNGYQHEPIGLQMFCGPVYKHDIRDLQRDLATMTVERDAAKEREAGLREENARLHGQHNAHQQERAAEERSWRGLLADMRARAEAAEKQTEIQAESLRVALDEVELLTEDKAAELARLNGASGCCVECENKQREIERLDGVVAELENLREQNMLIARGSVRVAGDADERYRERLDRAFRSVRRRVRHINNAGRYEYYEKSEALIIAVAELAAIDEHCEAKREARKP